MGMSVLTYYTAEMVRALPEDGNKYETVYGERLVNPSPRPWHEIVVKRLVIALDTYLIRERIGEVLGSRGDISWSRDTLVQPDVYVVPIGEVRTLDWTKFQNLLLIAEVLSPPSVRADRFTKRAGIRRRAFLCTGWWTATRSWSRCGLLIRSFPRLSRAAWCGSRRARRSRFS